MSFLKVSLELVNTRMGFAYEELVSGEEFIGGKSSGVHGRARHFVLVLVFSLLYSLRLLFWLSNMEMGIKRQYLWKKIDRCEMFLQLWCGHSYKEKCLVFPGDLSQKCFCWSTFFHSFIIKHCKFLEDLLPKERTLAN